MGFYIYRKIPLPIEEIIYDYESGMNLTQIGKKFGVSQGTIKRRLIEAGVYQHNRVIRRMIEATSEATRVQKIKDRERKMINFPLEQAISEYQSGMSPIALGEKYGVSHGTIRKRLKEAGVRKITAKERNMMNFPLEQVISEYQSGMTLIVLGEKYGVSETTIRKRLIEAGVQERVRGRKKIDLPIDQIWSDYESGMTVSELAEIYGVSKDTIRTRLKEADRKGEL